MTKMINPIKILLVSVLISYNCISQIRLPQGFKVQQVGKFDLPVNIAALPGNKMLFPTQNGKLYIMENGILNPNSILTLDSIWWQFEKGFLGVASDPDFEVNGYIYCYYTKSVTGDLFNGNRLRKSINNNKSVDPIRHKIVRYTLSGQTIVPNSKKTILNMDITPGAVLNFNHDGGTMRFGRDGKLYLATGEGDLWCACFTPLSTGCDWCNNASTLCPSISTVTGCELYQWATNMNTFYGKILRINTDGSPPSDNPYFTNALYDAQKYVYALGFRNPFTMNFKPGTDDLYINDVGSHGSGKSEEINKLTPTSVRDFGWPAGEGMLNNSSIYKDPEFTYPEGKTTLSGCAIVGGVFYNPTTSNWPNKYIGKYFFMDFCNGWINTLDFDNNNNVENFANGMTNINETTSGIGALAVSVSSNGEMYYLTRSLNANITGVYKISYQPISISGVTMTGNNIISVLGASLEFEAGVFPNDATDKAINWSINPTNLAILSISGTNTDKATIFPLSDGVITITAISNGNYSFKNSLVVTISGQIQLSAVNITSTSSLIINSDNGSLQLGAIFTPSTFLNKSMIWSIKEKSPFVEVSITKNGLLSTNGGNGTVTVVGTSSVNNAIFSEKVITITGQIVLPEKVTISNTNNTSVVAIDGNLTFVGSIIPVASTINTISWSVITNTGIASINSLGVLTAFRPGVITVVGSVNTTVQASFVVTITSGIPSTLSENKVVNSYKDIKIYPNPNNGDFYIESSRFFAKTILQITNVKGELVYETTLLNFIGKKKLVINNLASGLYRVSFSLDNGMIHYKMLVE